MRADFVNRQYVPRVGFVPDPVFLCGTVILRLTRTKIIFSVVYISLNFDQQTNDLPELRYRLASNSNMVGISFTVSN